MQCINKSQSFTGSPVTLVLLDTNYSIFARYGVISPASKVLTVVGNKITSEPYLGSVLDTENETWNPFIGTRVQLRLPCGSLYSEELLLQDVTPTGELIFQVGPTLPIFPVNNGLQGQLEKNYQVTDLILESVAYPQNGSPEDQQLWKDTYVYFNPRLTITNVIDESNFEVDNTDLLAIIEKAVIIVSSPDFSNQSQEIRIETINSNLITTNIPMSYLPGVGDLVDLVGFIDGGLPYRWF